MPRQYCKYHPLEPALWYNKRSHVAYCERCVDSSETLAGFGKAICYLSGEDLQYLGSANTAQPFWDRLGQFFRFPLHKNSLAMIAFLVLATWAVVAMVEVGAWPLLLIGGLFLLACVTRYGFMIIEHSANGRFEPPSLGEAFAGSGFNVLFQQVIVQVVFIVFIIVVSLLNSSLFDSLAQALVLFIWPASMMLLATEKSILLAVSPDSIWHFIRSIGWAYLLLYGFLFLLLGAQTAVFDIFVHELPVALFVPVFVAIALYFMMASYHLMGYVVFQYQADIGFVAEDQLARQKRRAVVDPVEVKVDLLVKEGQYQKAADTLARHLRENKNSLNYHEKYSRLLLAIKDTDDALAHGQFYMMLLAKLGDESRLYFLYNDLQKLDPAYMPEQPEVCLALAGQMFQRGSFKQVCNLLLNLHKRAPHFAQLPEAYLLMARTLIEGFDNRAKASQYLKYIQQNHSEFKRLEEVDQLLTYCAT